MSNSIIQVTNLSKSYIINHEGRESYTALRDVMARNARKIFSFPKSLRSGSSVIKEEFWALKNVNFEIEQGDAVGIIGGRWRLVAHVDGERDRGHVAIGEAIVGLVREAIRAGEVRSGRV